MKTLNIKYFGMLIEKTGHDVESIQVDDSLSLIDLKNQILSKYPLLKKCQFQTIYNKQHISTNCSLEHNAEIAFLPPFAGG